MTSLNIGLLIVAVELLIIFLILFWLINQL